MEMDIAAQVDILAQRLYIVISAHVVGFDISQ
jgi:hypothetical protein